MDIFDPVTAHYLITFAISFTTIVLACMLLGIPVPANQKLDDFRRAKQYLALSYFILGTINFVSFFSQEEAHDSSLLAATTVLIASYQALLFTSSILVLIQPAFVRKRFVLTHLGLITLGGAILFAALFMLRDSLFPFVFYPIVAAYLLQLAYFTQLFRRKYKACRRRLEDYYDEDEHYRLGWVVFSFYSALAVGILALISLFVNLYFYALFGLIYTAYYAYMAHRFFHYQINSKYILSAVAQPAEAEEANGSCEDVFPKESYEQLAAALIKWEEEKKYADKDISVDEIARQLGTSRYFLRHYFTTHIGSDFRTWRSELRIREAKAIMEASPELSANEVCDRVGFGDRSNFHKQFQKIIGMTPGELKRSLAASPFGELRTKN